MRNGEPPGPPAFQAGARAALRDDALPEVRVADGARRSARDLCPAQALRPIATWGRSLANRKLCFRGHGACQLESLTSTRSVTSARSIFRKKFCRSTMQAARSFDGD